MGASRPSPPAPHLCDRAQVSLDILPELPPQWAAGRRQRPAERAPHAAVSPAAGTPHGRHARLLGGKSATRATFHPRTVSRTPDTWALGEIPPARPTKSSGSPYSWTGVGDTPGPTQEWPRPTTEGHQALPQATAAGQRAESNCAPCLSPGPATNPRVPRGHPYPTVRA